MARTNSLLASGTQPTGIRPDNLLSQVVKGLYDSINTTLGNFGLSIPTLAAFVGGTVFILVAWSVIASIRNRKSFTLHDEEREEDGTVSESGGNVGSGIFRPTRYPEGSPVD
jgi:hypothetical protein